MQRAEPLDGPIEPGMSLWWAPHDPKSFEVVKVTRTAERDGMTYVETQSVRTGEKFWNRESRVRDLCKREPKRGHVSKGAEVQSCQ